MGLAGMRAPTSAARSLAPSAPAPVVKAVKQVKTPVLAPAAPIQAPVVPLGAGPEVTAEEAVDVPPALEPTVSVEDNALPTMVETVEPTLDSVLEEAHEDVAEAEMESMLDEAPAQAVETPLPAPVAAPVKPGGDVFGDRPILQPVRTLHALGAPRPTAELKPAMPVLSPAGKLSVLQPVTTMKAQQIAPVERLEPLDED
ncbi:MAG TPA: hypothetical protein HA286_00050 [Candidatus Poseidoniaceae archaeon]|nr:hypothetical protein [Candidatus Poseidoniaceae archaeon]